MPDATDVTDTVRTMLEAAGLTVSDEELEILAAAYPLLRSSADRLYAEEFRDEEPAVRFEPVTPTRPGR